MLSKSIGIPFLFRCRELFVLQTTRIFIQKHKSEVNPLIGSRGLRSTVYRLNEAVPPENGAAESVKNLSIARFRKLFRCTKEGATAVYERIQSPQFELDDIVAKVKWLKLKKATTPVILDNSELLMKPFDEIQRNFKLLRRLTWMKTDDFVPFLIMDETEIRKSPNLNSFIYELSKALSIEPNVVSKFSAKHPFVFGLERDVFRRKLKLVLNSGMQPEAMLRDLDCFRHGEDVIKKRLEFLAANKISRILPWMLKCSDKIIYRTIELRKKRNQTQIKISDYLATRLNLHGMTTPKLFKEHSFMNQLDLNKVTQTVDFLLEKFTSQQIRENILLLNRSLPELKRRISELESLGVKSLDPGQIAKKCEEFNHYLKSLEK